MSDPFVAPTLSGYNSSPPPDAGEQTEANRVKWSTIKTKLTDPLRTYADAISSAADTAFQQIFGSAVLAASSPYTVQAADRGKLISVTGTTTITLLASATATSGFVIAVRNSGSGVVTVDGNSSETIDGSLTATLNPGGAIILVCDGTNWFSAASTPSNVAFTNIANSFSLDQTITHSGETQLILASTDTTNGEKTSVDFRSKDSASNTDTFAEITMEVLDSTSTSEDAKIEFDTMNAGTLATRAYIGQGLVVGSPTGGDLGAGTINATSISLNGAQVANPLIQFISDEITAYTTTSATIPWDDTIPQNTEGAQLFSQAITMSSTTNKLRITVSGHIGSTINTDITIAFFQDSVANAIYAHAVHTDIASDSEGFFAQHVYTPGTTSPITIKVRWGNTDGTLMGLNGNQSGRKYGGVSRTVFTLEEIKA